MKPKKNTRTAVLVLIVLVALIVAVVGTIVMILREELSTVFSIRQVASYDADHYDGNVYTIDYKGGYYLDKYLEQGGVSSDLEMQEFIISSAARGIPLPLNLTIGAGCSSFNCVNEEGDVLFCRNYDLFPSSIAMVRTQPGNGRYSSLFTTDLSYCGVHQDSAKTSFFDKFLFLGAPYVTMDGMNEKGLVCSIYQSAQGEYEGENGICYTNTNLLSDKPDITCSTLVRLVLDYAATVDEAIEIIQQYDLHESDELAFHYSLIDATGKTALLEWINGTYETDLDGSARTLHIVYGDNENPLVITNFVLSDENYYSSDDQKLSLLEYTKLTEALQDTDYVVRDEAEAMDILKVAGRRGNHNLTPEDAEFCITLYSVIYNLTDKTVMLCANEHYGESEYTFTYDFEHFFDYAT